MPIYHRLGEVPRKRHVALRTKGGAIHYEELVGNKEFTGPSSLLYHLRLPEMAPFSERDIRRPGRLEAHDETGDLPVVIKSGNQLVETTMAHHPFDVVGWDGYYHPWALSIHDFEPRVGREVLSVEDEGYALSWLGTEETT
jgi:homogentisate 1,2-dioxygenase